MKNKELIELITELKQQLDESRDTDFNNYVGKLSKRASKAISELEVNDVVLDDVIKCDGCNEELTGVYAPQGENKYCRECA